MVFAAPSLIFGTRFFAMTAQNGQFASRAQAVGFFQKSGLPVDVIQRVWNLADLDKDNRLTLAEFCIGMHLVVNASRRNNPVRTAHAPPEIREPLLCGQ